MHDTALNIVVILTIFIGTINLINPFISKEDSTIRNIFLITTTVAFLLNVLVLDHLFLKGIQSSFSLITLGKYSLSFHLEPLGIIFLNLLAVLWICSLLYTVKFLSTNMLINSDRFLFFLNCCILSGVFVALSANLFTMFVFYELLTLFTIPLLTHQQNTRSLQGVSSYLKILMIGAIALFLPATIIIYSKTGTGDFIHGGFIANYFDNSGATILLVMMIFGITKTALFPLHGWLPAAMVASYPVSALLHAVVVVKTGLFCTYKIMLYVFGLQYLQEIFGNYNWLIFFPAITIIYSSLQILRFNDIKTVLAYSTINQLSIALLSAFLLSSKGLIGAVMHMVSHSFTKICMFYAAGNIYTIKKAYNLRDLIGVNSSMPKSSLIMLISSLSLIGIPPFAGFISKFYILTAAIEQANVLAIVTLILSSIITALYVGKIIIFTYKHDNGNKIGSKANQQTEKDLPTFMILSLALCLSGVVGFILIQQVVVKFLEFI